MSDSSLPLAQSQKRTPHDLAIKLAECSNRVRFKYVDHELADKILELANEVWDLPQEQQS